MPPLPSNESHSQDDKISFPSHTPKNWGPEQDTYLAHQWQDLTTSEALENFKHTISQLHCPGDPSTQVHPLSYDLHFLHDRLSHLLGPCRHESSFADPNGNRYFHSHWPRIQRSEWRFICLNCRNDPPVIFMHHLTSRVRCGHCGCETIYRFEMMANEFLVRYGSVQLGHQLRRKAILGMNLQCPEPRNLGQFWGVRKFQAAEKV